MKVLDKYILRGFFIPFFATFLVILFILVMQGFWLAFENFAGRGITTIIIFKFLWYSILALIPQAIPIAILLSSIMSIGNLAENYEYAAAKSAGIPLQRLLRPLIIASLCLTFVNFIFLNNVYPYARLMSLNLKNNIKHKEPSLALIPGSFNTEIPNYQIKFDEKYGENGRFLKNVIIYDLSANKGNVKSITAKQGEIVSEKGSRYLTLVLNNGTFFEHHTNKRSKTNKKLPASFATFDEYTINIDIAKFMDDDDLDNNKHTKHQTMLNLQQLRDTIPTIKENYDNFIKTKSNSIAFDINYKELYKNDSIVKTFAPTILENFDIQNQEKILKSASEKVSKRIENISEKYNKKRFKSRRKKLNLFDIEFYNRIALSFSCILLFFIGAPLGSIIKKGGMGLPMIGAIIIYVIYHFTNTLGKNMAEESTVTAFLGSWFSTILMTPIAIFLTIRAKQDKNIGSIKTVIIKIILFFKNLKRT